jgi:hypothetical protein
VFRYVRERKIFFETVVLVWMLAVHDGDHKHRMSRAKLPRPPAFASQKSFIK